MERPYFNTPKQVMFVDPDSIEDWTVGIAYRDEVICGCCGGIFEIADICEAAAEAGRTKAIYAYEDWMDIRYEICGDEWPEGLTETPDGEGLMEIPLEDEFIQMELSDVEASIGDYYTDGYSDEKISN